MTTRKDTKKTPVTFMGVLAVVFFVAFLFLPIPAAAQPVTEPAAPDAFGVEPLVASGLSRTDIRIIIANIIRAVLGLLGTVALVLILYAGYVIMTSEGSEDKVADGKRILANATIGLAIILSAFAIVQFVINALGRATGILGTEEGGSRVLNTFAGSGALGRIVKDHYPFRSQQDVSRNVRISVTFREPIDPASVIDDTNRSGAFGDCMTAVGQFNWDTDCDRIKTSAIQLFVRPAAGSRAAPQVLNANALTVPAERTAGRVTTFVFRPLAPLGNERDHVWYSVKLTGDIKKADGRTSAFVNDRGGYYAWDFETNTQFDYDPPRVVSLFPDREAGAVRTRVPRNIIVQIEFSEPVDPTTVQGATAPTSDFTTIVFGDPAVRGAWKIASGNRIAEFRSDDACGVNSCGETIYCLPRPPTGFDASEQTVLVRTAALFANPPNPQLLDKFQALPFSGVTDMYGNALDGGGGLLGRPDGVPQGKPAVVNARGADAAELAADNDFWRFLVEDKIKRAAPSVREMRPTIDREDIPRTAPVVITFSDRMWADPLDGILIAEHGLLSVGAIDPMWRAVHAAMGPSDRTVAEVLHREFGPNNEDAYYFPSVPSTVKNVFQNCLYPGRGPKRASRAAPQTDCLYVEDDNGVMQTGSDAGCAPVVKRGAEDTACMQTSRVGAWLQPNIDSCLRVMRDVSR